MQSKDLTACLVREKIAQLKLKAANSAADGFDRLIAEATQGELPEARAILLRSAESNGESLPSVQRNVIMPSIIAQQMDLAETILKDFLSPPCEVRLHRIRAGAPTRWVIAVVSTDLHFRALHC